MSIEDTKTLADIIANAVPVEGGHRFGIASNWMQGRTAFGGYTTAILNAAVQKDLPDLPPLRSVMINFTAPVSEAPVVKTEVLRQGRNMSTVVARAMIGEKVAATGTFSFGRDLESSINLDCPMSDVPEPDGKAVVRMEGRARPAPSFFVNFEMIPVEMFMPFSGADTKRLRMWVRHADPAMHQNLSGLLAIADCLPPVVLTRLTNLARNSSVNWMVNFPAGTPQTRDGWWLLESDVTAGQGGYSSQVMRVWNADRQLVIDGMQSVVMFE